MRAFEKLFVTTALVALCLPPRLAEAHARAGDRVFPATLAIDDPGVSDELTLPQVSAFKAQDEDGEDHWLTAAGGEYSKRITENFGVSLEDAYVHEQGGPSGFDNLGIGLKYQAIVNAEHEFMLSAGLDSDIGSSGSHLIGERHTAFTPAIFAGKGFGDLPDDYDWAKPFAVTGTAGVELPATGDDAQALEYGFTIQYSLPYMQQHVKDIGLGGFAAGLTPIVEFAFETPYDRGEHKTTGTVNPGVIWTGQSMQYGLEAILPVTDATGRGIGAVAQVHFYLDDLFPQGLGKPLFGDAE